MSGHFEFLSGFPPDVVAVSAHGTIDRAAYEDVLMPLIADRIKAEGKIKLLYVLGSAFKGFTAGAAWDDTRLGLSHLSKFARMAIVSDTEWLRLGMRMFAPLMPCPVRIFHIAQMQEAEAWIVSDANSANAGPEVAADHKINPLEDMMPPND